VSGSALDEFFAVPQIGAQRRDLRCGSKASAQQSDAVELLDPLAVQNIALAPGDILEVPGIHQNDLEAALLENLEDRDPVK